MVMNPLFGAATLTGLAGASSGTVVSPAAVQNARVVRRAEDVYAPPPPDATGSAVLDALARVQTTITAEAIQRMEVVDLNFLRRTYLGLPRLNPPFVSVRNALRVAWIKRHGFPVLRSDTVIAQINETVEQARATLNVEIEKVWEDTRFPATVQRMLAAGLIVGAAAIGIGTAIGAAAGVGFAGVGAVIGAAVGFVVGCLCALIPIQQWNVLGDWSTFVDCLLPIERYMLLGAFRRLFDENNARDHQPPYRPWSAGHAFRTIYTSDGTLLFCLHAVLERDCFPRPSANATLAEVRQARGQGYSPEIRDLDPVARYALAWCAAERNDGEPLEGSEQWNQFHAGRGSPWVRDLIGPFARYRAGDLRAKVIASGIADFDRPPVTPDIRRVTLESEPLIAAARARAAGTAR